MSLLDALIFGYRHILDSAGNLMPTRSRVTFGPGFTVTDDQATQSTIVNGGGGTSVFGATVDNSATGAINAASSEVAPGVSAGAIRFTGAAPALAGVANRGSLARILGIIAHGGPLIVRNDGGGASSGDRILTGTGADVTLPQGSAALLEADNLTGKWRLVGGPGGANPAGANDAIQTKNGTAFAAQGSTLNADGLNLDVRIGGKGVPLREKRHLVTAPTSTGAVTLAPSEYECPIIAVQNGSNSVVLPALQDAEYKVVQYGMGSPTTVGTAAQIAGSFGVACPSGAVTAVMYCNDRYVKLWQTS